MGYIHEYTYDVQIYDTDCFGVMWHGAYTKWFEQGRVKLLETVGLKLSKPTDEEGYIYPVVEQTFRFKRAAKMQDQLVFRTWIESIQRPYIRFKQQACLLESNDVTVEALTACMVLDMNWKTLRRLPQELQDQLIPLVHTEA